MIYLAQPEQARDEHKPAAQPRRDRAPQLEPLERERQRDVEDEELHRQLHLDERLGELEPQRLRRPCAARASASAPAVVARPRPAVVAVGGLV